MNHPSANFANEIYLDGLRKADATVVEALYGEFRQAVTRAVETAGGNYADGNTFFRVAVIQTAVLANRNEYPAETPIFFYLKNLAVAQYRDWLEEKEQELLPLPELEEAEKNMLEVLPDKMQCREFRALIKAKRQSTALPLAERQQVGDEHFNTVWSLCETIERRLSAGQIPDSGENKTIRNAFLLLVLLTVGYAAFTWFTRDQSPETVYQNNFQPPPGILEDMAKRYANDTIAPEKPGFCKEAFERADGYYQKKQWRETAETLSAMMDQSYPECQSDALFYLAIVSLQLDRPAWTLSCISKIEDLERFGEDIYWYMALAYVKIAAEDPSQKDIARNAVERARSNTEIPERKAQAEKMLQDLAE